MNYRQLLLFALIVTFLAACRNRTGRMLIGKWRSFRVENRDKDNFFKSSRAFIDSMGVGNSDSVNFEIYGVTNIDSLRNELRAQYDSAYAAQLGIDTSSIFSFNNDSTVTFSFPGRSETGKWRLDNSGALVLDETNEMGQTEQLKVDINFTNNNEMTLTFIRDLEEGVSDTSVVRFRREK
jgi:hypothetical protein